MITNRNLTPGTTLAATHKRTPHFCTVVEQDGKLGFRLHTNGNVYPSLSAAGGAVTDTSVNGWRFWSPTDAVSQEITEEDTDVTASAFDDAPVVGVATTIYNNNTVLQIENAPVQALTQPLANGTVRMRLSRSQNDLAEGEKRYFCPGCGDHFVRPSTTVGKLTCPNGHISSGA